jgi:hypothetical protein
MQIAESLLTLAGFAFAHATWSVSDLPKGELLVPMAIVERSGQRQLLRFEAKSQELAISEGKAALAQHPELDAWAFVREGQLKDGGVYTDVLTVEAKAHGMSESVVFVQRFRPFAEGKFKLVGQPTVLIGGKALSQEESARLLKGLYAGVQSHARAAEHWLEWSGP